MYFYWSRILSGVCADCAAGELFCERNDTTTKATTWTSLGEKKSQLDWLPLWSYIHRVHWVQVCLMPLIVLLSGADPTHLIILVPCGILDHSELPPSFPILVGSPCTQEEQIITIPLWIVSRARFEASVPRMGPSSHNSSMYLPHNIIIRIRFLHAQPLPRYLVHNNQHSKKEKKERKKSCIFTVLLYLNGQSALQYCLSLG